jgi:hypothetical protein
LIDLDKQMRSILAQLEMLSHGAITNYSPTGTGNGADTKPPTGELRPPHEHWARRWTLAVEHDEETELREATAITSHRENVIDKAHADLDSYRKRMEGVVVGETEEELETRIIRTGKGWSVNDVAQYCRCNPKFVRKVRRKAGVDEQNGTGIVMEMVARDERVERAKAMRERGMPLRAIAMHLGCDVATVHRDLAA